MKGLAVSAAVSILLAERLRSIEAYSPVCSPSSMPQSSHRFDGSALLLWLLLVEV